MSRCSGHEAYCRLENVRQGLIKRMQRLDWIPGEARATGEALERELWDTEERLLGREPREGTCVTC